MKDLYGGRRFLLTLLSSLAATILQWFGKLDPAGTTYAAITIATVAAYITGNVVERKNNELNKTLYTGGNDTQSDSQSSKSQ